MKGEEVGELVRDPREFAGVMRILGVGRPDLCAGRGQFRVGFGPFPEAPQGAPALRSVGHRQDGAGLLEPAPISTGPVPQWLEAQVPRVIVFALRLDHLQRAAAFERGVLLAGWGAVPLEAPGQPFKRVRALPARATDHLG